MSVDRKNPSPMARVDGNKLPVTEKIPAPLSRLILLRHTIAQPVFAAFLAGGVAGAVSRTVVSPLERLKILFQIQSAGRIEYKLPVGQGLMKMWRDEGWRGFMRGNGANCIRIIPYSAVQFASYNFYKKVSPPELEGNRVKIEAFRTNMTIVRWNSTWYAWTGMEKSVVRRTSRYHLSYLHISFGSRQNTALSSDCY